MPSDNRAYYDHNTRIFLRLGNASQSLSIHRALWGPGVTSRIQALGYADHLLVEQARRLNRPPSHILDLGCGVGASLFYLSAKLAGDWHGTGVTISPVQAQMARRYAAQFGVQDQISFLAADYTQLPGLQGVEFAFSVEAFILSPDPSVFFRQVLRVLRPGGRLAIIDDFLSPPGENPGLPASQKIWIETFRRGWHADGFTSPSAVIKQASNCGLTLLENRDLTPLWRHGTLRDRLVALSVHLGSLLRLRGLYWDSLSGGDALTRCADAGLSEYRMLVFEAGN